MFAFPGLLMVKVNLTDNAAEREARLNEGRAELARSKAACARLSQVSFVLKVLFLSYRIGFGVAYLAHETLEWYLSLLSVGSLIFEL